MGQHSARSLAEAVRAFRGAAQATYANRLAGVAWALNRNYLGGKRMAIILVHEGPTVTQENYEATVDKMTGGKARMESVSDWQVEGIIMHSAGQGPNGFRVIDVWESQEACDAFGAELGPVLEEVGITDPPQMYEAHTFVSA